LRAATPQRRGKKQKMNDGRGARVEDPTYSVRAEISREMVRLYKEQFGRGPTRARTEFAGPEVIICTLEDTLTPAEKRMAQLGDHQRLRNLRLYFQHASEREFCEVIERLLGRKVRAFVSGMDTESDVSAEVFYLAPDGLAASVDGNGLPRTR
jgi:uncharacterized protein YbcI